MDRSANVKKVQGRLSALGYAIGAIDGDFGNKTAEAVLDALENVSPHSAPAVPPKPATPPAPAKPGPFSKIPVDWLSPVKMEGIVVHWTAGKNMPTPDDTQHYHILIDGEGRLVRGTHTIADNVDTADGVYAAHTLHHNTGIIGVSLCGMLGAVETPFSTGPQPIRQVQYETLVSVLAQLCLRYGLTPDRRTVLSHAEVQDTLGITQRGKWDIADLPWNSALKGAHAIGDDFRARTAAAMKIA